MSDERRAAIRAFVEAVGLDPASLAATPPVWALASASEAAEAPFSLTLVDGQALSSETLLGWLAPDRAMPSEVPVISLGDLRLDLDPSARTVAVHGRGEARAGLPFVGGSMTMSAELRLVLALRASAPIESLSVEVEGRGSVEVFDGLRFEAARLVFTVEAAGRWSVAGGVEARLLEAPVAFGAQGSLETEEASLVLTAGGEAPIRLLALGEGLAFDATRVEVAITRGRVQGASADGAGATAAVGAGAAVARAARVRGVEWRWRVSAHCALRAGPAAFAGRMILRRDADRTAFGWRADAPMLDLPLGVPGHAARLELGIEELVAARRDGGAARAGRWLLEGTARAALVGLPPALAAVVADETRAWVAVSGEGLAVVIDRLLRPVTLPCPPVELGPGLVFEPGEVALDAGHFALRLVGGDVRFSVDVGLGLPSRLNHAFGTAPDGSPTMRVFRTWDPAAPAASIVGLRVGVDDAGGFFVRPLGSPLAALTVEEIDGETWCSLDLGEAGGARFMMPTFAYDGAEFTARGGFELVRPPSLPLGLLARLLASMGLEGLAGALPAWLPIRDINAIDADGHLDVGRLAAVTEAVGLPLPEPVRAVFEGLGAYVNQLPAALLSYLRFELPEGLRFALTVSGSGGVTLKLTAPEGRPLRGLAPLSPSALTGVELHGLTIGMLLSGTFVVVGVDARVDDFPVPQLLQCLVPRALAPWMPDTHEVVNRLTVDDFTVLVFTRGKVPIPIPLFYDALGVELRTPEGLCFQSSLRLPMPRIDLGEALRTGGALLRFVVDPEFELDPETGLESMDLRFAIGPQFVGLAPWIGGALELGTREDVVSLSAWRAVALALNAVKTGRLDAIMALVPLDHRIGAVDVGLFGLRGRLDWALATPAELGDGRAEALAFAAGELERILAVMGRGERPRGLVSLLRGRVAAGPLADVDLGLGAVIGDGAATGFRVGAAVAGGCVTLDAGGVVLLDAEAGAGDALRLSGRCALEAAGTTLMRGTVGGGRGGIRLDGALDLLPDDPWVRVTGRLAGALDGAGLSLAGDAEVLIGGFWSLAGESVTLDADGLWLRGSRLGHAVELRLAVEGVALALHGTMSPLRFGEVFAFTDAEGDGGPRITVRGGVAPRLRMSGAVTALGVRRVLDVDLVGPGLALRLEGRLFDRLDAVFELVATAPETGEGLRIDGRLDGAALTGLADGARALVDAAAAPAVGRLVEARAAVAAAREMVQAREQAVEAARAQVRAERDAAQAAVRQAEDHLERALAALADRDGALEAARARAAARRSEAEAALARASAEVERRLQEIGRFDGEVERARATVRGERRTLTDALDRARARVEGAAQAVDRRRREIDELHRWFDGLPAVAWPGDASKASEAVGYGGRVAALEGLLLTEKGALEAAKGALAVAEKALDLAPVDADPRVAALLAAVAAAEVALGTARLALDAARAAADQAPIDADPEVMAHRAPRDAAALALTAAREALARAEEAAGLIPIDADPRVAGPLGLWRAATAALDGAQAALDGLAGGLGALGRVAAALADRATGLLIVHRAAFTVVGVDEPRGTLAVDAELGGRRRDLTLTVDLRDPAAIGAAIGRALLDGEASVPAPAPVDDALPGGASISLLGHHGRFLVAEADGRVNANRAVAGPWEHFTLVAPGPRIAFGQRVALHTHHGTRLAGRADGRLAVTAGPAAEADPETGWILEPEHPGSADGVPVRPGDIVRLRGVHGCYLVAEEDGRAQANRPHAGPWEAFRLAVAPRA
ncbi:MAG: hypothetical protein H6705_18820 [Myxococcales bacterium]|nr:hypothetical protein [Myxococcales bacterium]